jgi:hypothetical protein
MPKNDIDYSNTIIYKIICNDKTINDVYVGHTTNFTKRKYLHKIACNNLDNKLKIYDTIRQHGGFDNWEMVEIEKYNCKDKTEARIKEQHHYEELKSTLNSCPPCLDKKKYFCTICNLQCNTPKSYETHINCDLHKKKSQQLSTKINKEGSEKFKCISCNYFTSRKSQYDRHLTTNKHNKQQITIKINENVPNSSEPFECECGKKYKDRSGLWRHKKTCTPIQNSKIEEPSDKQLIMMLIKENSELKHLVLNVFQKIKPLNNVKIDNNTL